MFGAARKQLNGQREQGMEPDFFPDPKPKTWRSKPYRDWIKHKPCLFCDKPPPNDAHHVLGILLRGMGTKPSDSVCIPACRTCHRKEHQDRRWHDFDLKKKIIEYLTEYLCDLPKV